MGGIQSQRKAAFYQLDPGMYPLRSVATIFYPDDTEDQKCVIFEPERSFTNPLGIAIDIFNFYQMRTEIKINDDNIEECHLYGLMIDEVVDHSQQNENEELTVDFLLKQGKVLFHHCLKKETFEDGFAVLQTEKLDPKKEGRGLASLDPHETRTILIFYGDQNGHVYLFYYINERVASRLTPRQLERVKKLQETPWSFPKDYDTEKLVQNMEGAIVPTIELLYFEIMVKCLEREIERRENLKGTELSQHEKSCIQNKLHSFVNDFEGRDFLLTAKDRNWRPLLYFFIFFTRKMGLDLLKSREFMRQQMGESLIKREKASCKFDNNNLKDATRLEPRLVDSNTAEWVFDNHAGPTFMDELFKKTCLNFGCDVNGICGEGQFKLLYIHRGNTHFIVHVIFESSESFLSNVSNFFSSDSLPDAKSIFPQFVNYLHNLVWVTWLEVNCDMKQSPENAVM